MRLSLILSKDVRYYLDASGAVNLTRIHDEALTDLQTVEENGVGKHKLRSRGVVQSRVVHLLAAAGWTVRDASRWYDNQVRPSFTLWANSRDSEQL